MLRLTMLALGASLIMGAGSANEASAQSARDRAEAARRGTVVDRRGDVVVRENDRRWEDRNRRDRNDDSDWDTDGDSDRKNKKNKNKKNGGPKFCQNGEGHPVHGMEWCRQKGYDTGYGVFSRVDWGDVVLRRPRDVARQRDLSRGTLQDILGGVVLGRFDRQRNRLGLSQPLYGRWVDSDAGAVLRLLSGSQPIAQIIDRNRDGRADVVLLYNGR
jgi:cell division protein FtsI/penicillin-binding protein 2